MVEQTRKLTALVVENDDQALPGIRDHLARAGFVVRAAASGWEALKLAKEDRVDIVISDLAITAADGSALREKFLLEPSVRDVPFVFLAPKGLPDGDAGMMRSGVDECLVGSLDPVALVARVQTALARRSVFEELLRVDPLTQVLNRPVVEREVAQELARIARYERFGSLAVLELDGLEEINAECGQGIGDLFLATLGGVILSNMRNVDVVGRLRGSKFLFFLPETRKLGAATLFRRIRDRFARAAEALAGVKAGFSVGIAEAPADGADLASLCARAERAANVAKLGHQGKFVLWTDDVAAASAIEPATK